uniref:Ig-like domain-containing protein n=1 Tax=Chelydra serpentina TaxID=8475 RepID=A0A8C3SRD6_CHESE
HSPLLIWPLGHMSLMGNVTHRTSQPDRTDQFLCFSEFQAYDVMEGQNLSIQCPYNTQYFKEKKAWCRSTVQNDCEVLVNTEHGVFGYQNKAQEGRARIHDDTQKGIVTITMENLQVDDAGVYWCARYRPPNLYRIIEVKLAVTKGEYLLVGKMWGVGFLFCKFQAIQKGGDSPVQGTLSDIKSISELELGKNG